MLLVPLAYKRPASPAMPGVVVRATAKGGQPNTYPPSADSRTPVT